MKKIIIILALGLFACNAPKKIKSDYQVDKNEPFEIKLKSNQTTGYSWKWLKNDSSKIVEYVSTTYIQDKTKQEMAGVGGKEVFKFKGNQTGVDTLIFEYCRSWDKNSTAETKKIIVEVK